MCARGERYFDWADEDEEDDEDDDDEDKVPAFDFTLADILPKAVPVAS